ncbi:hypothetical protein CQA18_27040, partial [Enterobacter hormaechei]|uniref:TonB-dependent receptor domain-containing protein n=1 Tax=Enterobacter hormaechei TaxID=158836 RepID=UPI000BDDE5DE
ALNLSQELGDYFTLKMGIARSYKAPTLYQTNGTTMLTPGLRYDLHSESGNNWSPALNLSQELGDYFTLKMGIARSYKAPTLYQTNG